MSLSSVDQFFGSDSPLKQAEQFGGPSYEPRPQQVTMAKEVAKAFEDKKNLCVEAPTGVGKTFAYLIPAYYYSIDMGKPVVISTHTINLQEQIVDRDLPLLEKLLQKKIYYALAKGRSNYLCLRRLSQIADMNEELLPGGKKLLGEMGVLIDWVNKTDSGDRAELQGDLSSKLWELVQCERGNCLGGNCPFNKKCFLNRAKRNCKNAEIIIANHAFFFSALAMQAEVGGSDVSNSLLPEYCAVIMDEGHTLEDTAAEHLGLRADTWSMRRILNRLYSEKYHSGLLRSDSCASARKPIADLRRMLDLFIPKLIEWMEQQNVSQGVLRYTCPGHIENYLDEYCHNLECELDRQTEQFKDNKNDDVVKELKALKQSLHEQNRTLNVFFQMKYKAYVYWFEISGREHKELIFNCLPVDVAPILKQKLFDAEIPIPVIITSATLAVNGNIRFFTRRIGCPEARTMMLDSPFHYEDQVTVYIPENMPDPRDDAYQEELEKYIKIFIAKTGGCAFVLFTSYYAMHLTAEHLEMFFAEKKIELLMQGEGYLPRRMLELFREREHAVIFGTSSFWTGVDVPGKALSNVIITKLPFAVPSYPLVAARGELITARGGSSFAEYSLPDAVLKFRQGFGRLIRTSQDRGIVVVLDGRIRTKRYGKTFLNSIPKCNMKNC